MIEWPHNRANAERLRRRLLEMCNRRGVPVIYRAQVSDDGRGLGRCYQDRIEVKDMADVIEETRTLVHELAHACLHYDENGEDCGFPKWQEEREANACESVILEAYACGPETPSGQITPRVAECCNFLIAEVEHEKHCDLADVLTNLNAALEA